jgi:hypothetical protein
MKHGLFGILGTTAVCIALLSHRLPAQAAADFSEMRQTSRSFHEQRSAVEDRLPLARGWQLQDAGRVPEPGEVISSGAYRPTAWIPATVPGTVLTSMVAQGLYPEPLYGLDNLQIPESLNKASYWYRVPFDVPAAYAGKVVWLNFDGINHKAEIWLNGSRVGAIKGAFKRESFDVTRFVSPGSQSHLAVKILPPRTPGVPHEQTLDAAGGNGGLHGKDSPAFLASIGWDWMPGIRDRNVGIWQDVYLRATGPVVLRHPLVRTDLPLPRTDSAELTVSTELHNATDALRRGVLRGRIEDVSFEQEIELAPGETREVSFTPAAFPQLTLRSPRLWWPNGYGRQDLYQLDLEFVDGATVSDRKLVRFGVRELSYAFQPELQILVNGHKILAKGGNWGLDEAMKRNDRKRFEAQIRFHKEANLTMIRNWVGMTDDEDFYDLADESGILIWDDFWLANPVDGPDPDDPALFLDNARDKIKRYRNHPSIALWCARNEGFAPAAIAAGLDAAIRELDGTRRFQRSSSDDGVHGHGPYRYQEPESYFKTHARGFTTEIGLPSIPSVESVRRMMPAEDLWPINDTWGYHDFTGGACDSRGYLDAMRRRLGPPTGVEDFCRKGQMMNYETYKAIFEAWNRKLWQDTSGVLLWMSNPAQPSFVWQLYDYYLEPTASFFGVKKACEPLHVQLNLDDLSVSVINNRLEALQDLEVTARIFDLRGREQAVQRAAVSPQANSASQVFGLVMPEGLSKVYFVKLTLTERTGRLLSENFYWRARAGFDLQALDTLPEVQVDGEAQAVALKDELALVATISNPSQVPALAVRLKVVSAATGERVLPVFFDDNYVSLLPGETKQIRISFRRDDLGDTKPRLMVSGWNVAAGELPVRD